MSNHFRDSNIRPASPIVFKSGAPVSVVCVAATYTGITYADNGGKVKLFSAGVHGLTTSPAVGANVYVSWSSGTGVSGLYTVLSVDSTTAITVDLVHVAGLGTPTVAVANTEINLVTFQIPVLSKNSKIKVEGTFSHTGSTNSKLMSMGLASVKVSSRDNTVANNVVTRLSPGSITNRDNTGSQVIENVGLNSGSSAAISTATIDTSVSTSFFVSGKPSEANEIIKIETYLVEVFI